jgi:MFS family permease
MPCPAMPALAARIPGRQLAPGAAGRPGVGREGRIVTELAGTERRARLREVLGVPEFRVLLVAQAQSRAGDQLARVALALLVFDRTSSAVLTTLVYALTYLPPLLSAPWLAGLADRYPRRTVMVATDLVRAGLVAVMAVPAVPLPAVAVLLVLLTCPQPLFSAARNATLPQVLAGDRFPVGMSIVSTTDFLAQIAGFTLGGVMVAALGGPHAALAIDAVTYLVSAALIRRGLRPHMPEGAGPGGPGRGRFPLAAIGIVVRDRQLGGLAALLWLFGFYLAPAALAAPYAAQVGAGKAAVGVLMAADLPGAVLGGLLVARVPPGLRQRLMVPLAVATGLPLLATALVPSVPLAVLAWAGTGVLSSYLTLAQVAFTRAVPDAIRARAIGLASAGLQTAQGLGVLLAGAIAEAIPPADAIAVCGAAGVAGAIVIALTCRPGSARPAAATVAHARAEAAPAAPDAQADAAADARAASASAAAGAPAEATPQGS